ncbi:hypothetical protein [Leptotrichia sp. oral taxon 879]|uniref:Lipoprotein n=1 Tax=Leptotrichia mesophila TaxID=3239303 RepID=A0AB39VCM2_9FUSO|nr:hypothetical protein [Leptotrichia sp. oral taxon 879]
MKKILMLMILVLALVTSCSYFESAERIERERGGVECRYNKRGGVEDCRYAN